LPAPGGLREPGLSALAVRRLCPDDMDMDVQVADSNARFSVLNGFLV